VSAVATAETATPPRTWLKVLGGIVSIALVLGGAYRILAFLARDSFTVRATYTDVRALYVKSDHGSVRVVAEPPGSPVRISEHVVRAFLTPKRTVVRAPGGVLRLHGDCREVLGTDCSVSYTVFAPPEVSLLLSAARGNVVVRDIVSRTPLKLSAAAGSVIVDGLTAPRVDLSSAAGSVLATRLHVPVVSADSAAGDVRLAITGAPRSITAESTAGNVHLTVPDAVYEVDAGTVAGDSPNIKVRQDPSSPLKIKARSTAGNVTIVPGRSSG
jgi:Toastrack DUF4097